MVDGRTRMSGRTVACSRSTWNDCSPRGWPLASKQVSPCCADRCVKRLPDALRQIGTTGNLPLHGPPKSVAYFWPSRSDKRGGRASSRTRDGMWWTRQRRRAVAVAGRVEPRERWRARRTNDVSAFALAKRGVAYGKSVWSWHPLLVPSRRWRFQTRPGLRRCISADDGDKTNSSPGRARHKP
jgi:hypothetical protein